MKNKIWTTLPIKKWICGVFVLFIATTGSAFGADLQDIKQRGIIHHLGVPYANFVTGAGDGLDVELMQLFAKHLGVKYKYIKTTWKDVIGDLTGKKVKANGGNIVITGKSKIKGDVVANGFTILPWRKKIVDFSMPNFPTQVWLIARADSRMKPIKPSGDIIRDIKEVKAMLSGYTVLGIENTCLEPSLYGLKDVSAKVKLFSGNLNELAPAIINNDAESSLLDVPDALIALQKWPGKIKVIGPVSQRQKMGCGFSKNSPKLREAFNDFF